MWVAIMFILPAELFAQNEATLGKWDRLYRDDNAVIRWRINTSLFDWDQRFTDANNVAWSRDRAWDDIYGIHAALLPVSGETGALQRGWVILWGYNDQRGDFPAYFVPGPEVEPFYFANLRDAQGNPYWVPRLATTSVLLWHPEGGETQAAKYGYVRYLFDTHPWNEPGEYPPYNLFCSGHALLPDGRLFVAGGHGGLRTHTGASADGYIGLRLLSIFQAQNFRRDVTAFRQSLWWTYFPPAPRTEPEAPEPRWYPTVVALPDGKMLIVGGTWYSTREETHLTERHEIFDPCTLQVVQSLVNVPSHLGENYPRLHLVSFVQNGQVQFGVVYTGPGTRSYFLANPSSPLSEWQPYDPQRAVYRGSGTSVLLPNPVENPQRLEDQVLSQVLTIGGSGDRSGSMTLSYDLNDFSNGTLAIARYFLPDHNMRVHLNAVLLPTGQVLVVGGNKTDRNGSWYYPGDVVLETLLYAPPADGSSPGRWDVVASAPSEFSRPIRNEEREEIPTVMDGTRVYHSTALLLPDGRVLTAGSATGDTAGYSVTNYVPTLYSPPYLFKADGSRRGENERPRIMLFLVDENGVPSKAAWVRLKAPDCLVVAEPARLTVELEGVQGMSAEQAEAIERSPLTLEFRHPATGATIASYTLPMGRPDEQGQVRLALWSDLPAGTYELYVHPYRSWLGRRVRINWQRGGSYRLWLRNGDVVKDNRVDMADFAAVLTQLGVQGVCEADVNCDGIVDAEDAALVATNVGTEGDE